MRHLAKRRSVPLASRALVIAALLGALLAGCAMIGPRQVVATPSHITLSDISSARTITVSYAGPAGSTVDLTAVVTDPRITVQPPAFRLSAGGAITVTIRADLDEVPSTFTTNVRFVAPGVDDAVVTVSLAPGCFIDPEGPVPVTAEAPGRSATAADVHVEPATGLAFVPGELLVTYREVSAVGRAVPTDAHARRMALGADVASGAGAIVARAGVGRGHDLLVAPEAELDEVARRLRADPRVAEVSRNYLAHRLQHTLPDTHYGAQWHLYDFGVEAAWAVEDLRGGGPDVVIAIVDDGVNVDHVDLAPKLLAGRDVYCGDDDVRAISPHGSHVAGIAAAGSSSDGSIVGVAVGDRARILPVKVFPDNVEMSGTLDSVNRGLRFAGALDDAGGVRADVVNMSLGFGTTLPAAAAALLQATIDELHGLGIVIVAAAGNTGGGTGVTYPARLDNVIAVGSVDWEFTRSSFSTFGLGLDLMAPGGTAPATAGLSDDICRGVGVPFSRVAIASAGARGARSVACLSGTSMAAPFVSGTVALLIGHDPALRGAPDAVLAVLAAAAHQPAEYDPAQYGSGIVCPDALFGLGTICAEAP